MFILQIQLREKKFLGPCCSFLGTSRTIEEILDPSASARLRIGFRRGSDRSATLTKKRAVRELRQRRAYYRCCIPALAGFVSRRSIAPDGSIPMDQLEQKGNGFLAACPRVSVWEGIGAWSLGLGVLGCPFWVLGFPW